MAASLLVLGLATRIPGGCTNDPLLVVDGKESETNTKLPNSHSAAFVMGFIVLCLLAYGAYRLCRCRCAQTKQQLTVSLDAPSQLEIKGLENYIREHEEYLAIYGPRKDSKNLHTCEFRKNVD